MGGCGEPERSSRLRLGLRRSACSPERGESGDKPLHGVVQQRSLHRTDANVAPNVVQVCNHGDDRGRYSQITEKLLHVPSTICPGLRQRTPRLPAARVARQLDAAGSKLFRCRRLLVWGRNRDRFVRQRPGDKTLRSVSRPVNVRLFNRADV